jgi:hypothetical protein
MTRRILTAAEIAADPTVFMRDRTPVDEAEIGRRLAASPRRITRIRELRRPAAAPQIDLGTLWLRKPSALDDLEQGASCD